MQKDKTNYMTPSCFKRLSDEMEHLLKVERPETTRVIAWAAGNGDRSENADYIYGKKKLREIDRRLRFLKRRIEDSVVIDPLEMKSQKIQFSATVTVEDEEGLVRVYTIVGADEIDTSRRWVSWKSPIGKALLGKEVGEVVTIVAPKEKFDLEITNIEYKEII